MHEGVIVSCAGTLSTRSRGGRASVFNRVVVEEDAIHIEFYRWDAERGVFRRSDRHQFARKPPERGREAGGQTAGAVEETEGEVERERAV